MPYFSRDNLEFCYRERGDGVPCFFQHGLGGDTDRIFDLIQLPARYTSELRHFISEFLQHRGSIAEPA